MPIETAADLAQFFDAEGFGSTAVYTTDDIGPVDLVVIIRQGTVEIGSGDSAMLMDTDVAEILASDVALPEAGASLAVRILDQAGQLVREDLYTLRGGPRRDGTGRIWTCPVTPA